MLRFVDQTPMQKICCECEYPLLWITRIFAQTIKNITKSKQCVNKHGVYVTLSVRSSYPLLLNRTDKCSSTEAVYCYTNGIWSMITFFARSHHRNNRASFCPSAWPLTTIRDWLFHPRKEVTPGASSRRIIMNHRIYFIPEHFPSGS